MAETQTRRSDESGVEIVWQVYKAARLRKESATAHEKLCEYLHKTLETETAALLPPVTSERNRFGLVPSSLAFCLPQSTWLLSSRPSELIEALEEHADLLLQQMSAKVVTSDLTGGEDSVAVQLFSHCVDFTKTAARLTLCHGNYGAIARSKLSGKVMKMTSHLWTVSTEKMSKAVLHRVFLSLIYTVVCLHSMLDPSRTWQRLFIPDTLEWDQGVGVVTAPTELVPLFVSVFTQREIPLHFGLYTELYTELRLELLHMMGALLSSVEANARHAAVSSVCLPLLTLLDPRETISPLQCLTVSVVIKATHALHCCVPADQQVQVDVSLMLSGFLNILTPRYCDDGAIQPCYQTVITVLDAVPVLVAPPTNAEELRQLLLELGCHIKITELMNTTRDSDPTRRSVLSCCVLRALTAVMTGSPTRREAYESTVSYTRLRQLLSDLTPNTDVLSQAINMVVEGEYQYESHTHSIYNTWALAMLLQWLPTLGANERAWLADRLCDVISFSAHNRQRCCGAGLITVVIEVLCASQEEGGFTEEVEVLLVHILEVLGSHSIQTAELKQVIGALRPLQNGQLPTYYYSVQKALSVMSHDVTQEGAVPLYYFDLRPRDTIITIPHLTHFPSSSSSSLSFHTWVCLDCPQTTGRLTYSTPVRATKTRPHLPKRRRTLFSFYSSSGSGFEAFFTNSLILVVAVATKKEFTTLALSDYPLSPLVWHSVCVVYHGARRPWQKGEMRVYVDGELRRTVAMRGPSLSDTYRQCHIGSIPLPEVAEEAPSLCSPQRAPQLDSLHSIETGSPQLVQTVGLSEVSSEWGHGTNMRGLLSSLCLFSDNLSPASIKTLHRRGPNDLSLFQPKCPETRDLASRLFVYYHAKACHQGVCMNLSPSSPALDGQLEAYFRGQHYVTRDVKAALSSLGGVGLLFPLLEQVDIPVMKGRGSTTRDHTPSPTTHTPIVWFDSKEGVASFLRLLVSMLSGSPTNQRVFFLTEGPAVIAALLKKVTPTLLTVQALTVIQDLVALLSNHDEQHWQLMSHLLFNFHIWSRPDFSVRIGHTNFILSVVRENQRECRCQFGVQYFLDVIRVFYSSMGSHVPHEKGVTLTTEEALSMRSALLSIIKLYLSVEVPKDEVDVMMVFLSACSDCSLQEELLKLLLSLLLTLNPTGLAGHLWAEGLPLMVLIRAESMSVRLITIKILSHLYMLHGGVSTSPLHLALSSGSLAAAICQMTQHDLSSSLILALLELCVAKQKDLTEYISNFSVYFSILQLLRNAPLSVRYTICQQLVSILHLTPTHINEFSSFPDWANLFLWLLTPFDPSGAEMGKLDGGCVTGEKPAEEGKKDQEKGEDREAGETREKEGTREDLEEGESKEDGEDGEGKEGDVVRGKGDNEHSTVKLVESVECDDVSVDCARSGDGPPVICGAAEDGGAPRFRERSRPAVPAFRKRLSAFSPSPSPQSGSLQGLPDGRGSGGNEWGSSVTYSTSWTQRRSESCEGEKKGERVWQTLNIVTETIGCILWHSVDYDMRRPPWKVWGMFFSSLDTFTTRHTLILPPCLLKQRIFTLLMNALKLDAEGGNVDHASLLAVVLQLSLLFETFVLTACPQLPPDKDEQDLEVELLNLSFTVSMDLNPTHCTVDLFEHYITMLSSAGVFESTFHSATDLELGQSVMRILLAAITQPDKEYYVRAAAKLSQLISHCQLPVTDCVYVLGHLSHALKPLTYTVHDHPEQVDYMISIIQCIISCHGDSLSLDSYLPGVPDPSSPSFSTSFLSFSLSQEWDHYCSDVLLTEVATYHKVLLPWLHTVTGRLRECGEQCAEEETLRKELTFQNELTYEEDILTEFFQLRDQELERQKSYDNQQRNDQLTTLQRWRGILRFFTGERGAWSNRVPESYLWKLNRTENFSRMRLKLSRDYHGNRHSDASHMRDIGTIPDVRLAQEPTSADTALLSLVKASRSQSLSEDDDALEQPLEGGIPLISEGGPPGGKEEVVRRESCDLVLLMDRVAGRLELTTHHIFFYSNERREGHNGINTDFKIRLDQLREIHSRRYNMQRTAVEIFLTDQTNYFINFTSSKVVSKVYNSIISLRTPNLTRVGIRKPARLLQSSGLTQKWIRREISNFDYLMQLNTISGRTYNDLNQYPVFPWVVVDYESDKLNLKDPATFRDFTKPVGIQNPAIEASVKERYEEFDDPTMDKFHFGSHYSNAAGVLHYLIRLEPFTSLHIELQGGRFDHADRQFFSLARSWETIYRSGTDVKELIPEFFYIPDFLKNCNDYDLGQLQSGGRVGPVELPRWAHTPEEFIRVHREALECDYVSSQLHHWIDLIFGYKQTGPEAEKATNLFSYYSYEDNVNLEKIVDETEKRQIESIINNFGQTPTQLFTEPHPQRMTSQDTRRFFGKGYGKRSCQNLFDHLDLIKTHCVEVASEEDPVVFVGTPTIQTRALIASGNPEQLVTVTRTGHLNVHGWLPFSSSKTRPFNFQFDSNAHFDKSKWQSVAGPFTQDLAVTPNLFVLSPNNKLLVTCGHWDNSFRVYSIEKSKLLARNEHHNDIVTCMALDRVGTGEHLITGSRDTTCVVWRFGSNEVFDHPLQTLYGHDSEVTCVDISTELDMAISGAKDGTCIIHTVRRGHYICTLLPRKDRHKCVVCHAHISSLGRLLVYTEDKLARSKDVQCQLKPPCLHLYTVNGDLITEKDLSECLNAVVIVDKYLVTGNARGFLTFRDLFTLRQVSSVNLLEAVMCISVVLDHLTKQASHLLVALERGKLIIVSVGNTPSQKS